jgi:flagellar motor switch protein FliN/FliY
MAENPPPDGGSVDQAGIDELLRQAGMLPDGTGAAPSASAPAPAAPAGSPTPQTHTPEPAGVSVDQASIDELLRQASFDDAAAVGAAGGPAPPDAARLELPSFNQVLQDAQASGIDLLRDVEMNVKIELGRARMLVEDVLKLGEGSVVELDKLAGDPVDVFVNDRLVARGEVLVLNDNFCVRVNEIVAAAREELV